MPFASGHKFLIRELEIMILLADEDDDEKTVKKLVKLHELVVVHGLSMIEPYGGETIIFSGKNLNTLPTTSD